MKISDVHGNFLCYTPKETKNETIVYIKYIDVRDDLRNQGYGTKLLEALLKIYADDTIIANIKFNDIKPPSDDKEVLKNELIKMYKLAHRFNFYTVFGDETSVNNAITTFTFDSNEPKVKRLFTLELTDDDVELDVDFWMQLHSLL